MSSPIVWIDDSNLVPNTSSPTSAFNLGTKTEHVEEEKNTVPVKVERRYSPRTKKGRTLQEYVEEAMPPPFMSMTTGKSYVSNSCV